MTINATYIPSTLRLKDFVCRMAHPDIDGNAADAGADQRCQGPCKPFGIGIAELAGRRDLHCSVSLVRELHIMPLSC